MKTTLYTLMVLVIGILLGITMATWNTQSMLSRWEEATLKQLEVEFKYEIEKGYDFFFLNHFCYGLKEGGVICKKRK